MEILKQLKFDENGLIPVVVQHYASNKVLMVAYMNEEAYLKTAETKKATFYSRSRKKLWVKGETSGNFMNVKKILADCDLDCLILKVNPAGPACHTGNETCFYREIENETLIDAFDRANAGILQDVYNVALDRKNNPKEGSYTNYLFDKGIDKILKKVGEETSEVIIGAKNPGNGEIRYEIADLLYHLSVLMVEKELTWAEVYEELASRYAK
jgi:phosphoribosyl-ATP pyrophosphohydrolase/phosphoribosyl-AMP cyclohydrolase